MIRLTTLLTLLLTALATKAYTPLDPNDPVIAEGDSVVWNDIRFSPSTKSIFVDMNLSDEYLASHPYAFRSFTEAMAHLTDGTPESPMNVYIAPGVYWVDDPDEDVMRTGMNGREPFGLVIKCDALHITGLTSDPHNVVICAARGHTQGAWGNFTMLDITGDDFIARNLTLGNFCNVDLEFPLDPKLNRPKRNKAITQAHVAYLHGDRAVARNVRFISRLNMNPLNGARRILFDGCHMESTDDALTGTGVYLGCTLDFYAPRPFWNTHENGAVFLDCDFTVAHSSGRQYFCKSVGPLSIIDCRYHTSTPTYVGWTHYPTAWLRGYQSNVSLDGKPVAIGSERPENTVDITDMPQLEAFRVVTAEGDTIYNTYSLLRGDDGWDPMGVAPLIERESRRRQHDITAMPTFLGVAPRECGIETGDSAVTLTAYARRHAGYDTPTPQITWSVSEGGERFVSITPDGEKCVVRSVNHTDTAATVEITATTPEGLQGVAVVTASPSLLPAPAILKRPEITVGSGKAVLTYTLDLGHRDDRSEITWYKATSADLSDARPIAVSRYGDPLTEIPLTSAEAGRYIFATLAPAHIRSLPAESVATAPVLIKPEDVDAGAVFTTDFANFPTTETDMITPGFWTVGGFKPADTADFAWAEEKGEYWYYGTGINGATGRGLSQRRKGARLMYTPMPDEYGDMTLTLLVDPAKTAGQGFGSATGQYLDVCIKFDPATLTGYALRIIRTTRHSNAVDFQLMRYDNGVTTPVGEAVTGSCYRTGCTIILAYRDGLLTADVSTSTPLRQPDDADVHTEIHLSSSVEANSFGGIAVQHTGSTGESATMLHHLTAEWE
ncbi:MAG: hypothetical protein HDS51_09260 [Barnesiella sp.]|nr:hypothetical protein [Barnesiella sp.]